MLSPPRDRPWGVVRGDRSHSDALVGCMVWSTAASSSADNVSKSTSSRRRALNLSMVLAALLVAGG